MLFFIAWRNVWRQRIRSLVIIMAMIVGVWGLTLAIGFINAFTDSYLDNIVKYELAHMQVHHPKFKDDFDLKYDLKEGDVQLDKIKQIEGVKGVTARSIVSAMISSSKTASGVKVIGIDRKEEPTVSNVEDLIIEGEYLDGKMRNPIILGEKLAEKLNVKIRSKLVLTFQNELGDITAAAFRVNGIYKAQSPKLNEGSVFVRARDIARSIGAENKVNEVAILLEPTANEDSVYKDVSNIYQQYLVEKWSDIAPEIEMLRSQSKISTTILVTIFMLALVFGIVNTMLMAVLERIRELGMLMAIGMNKIRVFSMILFETFYLGLISCPIGLFFGYLTLSYFSYNGFDLSSYAKGLEDIGYSTVVYPTLAFQQYAGLAAGIFITALLGAMYPAFKAIRLKPVEALNKI
ncbi:ABC transporter permease [Fulvivirgaceae bacterium BMA10]|uniref:ABC transporter permease n=1 Tax=Splendidivirga corallicola TaxID=3051826 RepID=A0ABT8KH16_9BACT|nr:ABC transporter permease [Fulvivirgaceae bacterium BMA10]